MPAEAAVPVEAPSPVPWFGRLGDLLVIHGDVLALFFGGGSEPSMILEFVFRFDPHPPVRMTLGGVCVIWRWRKSSSVK